MARMRTAAKVLELIKAEDPGTEVTLHYIRYLIKTGAVPCVEVGRKKLVDADVLIRRIAEGTVPAMETASSEPGRVISMTPGIRRVAP